MKLFLMDFLFYSRTCLTTKRLHLHEEITTKAHRQRVSHRGS
jgi:hypothetical protein